MIRRGKKSNSLKEITIPEYTEKRKTKKSMGNKCRLLNLTANQSSKKTGKEKQGRSEQVYHDIRLILTEKKIPQTALLTEASQNSKVLDKNYLFFFNLLNQI